MVADRLALPTRKHAPPDSLIALFDLLSQVEFERTRTHMD